MSHEGIVEVHFGDEIQVNTGDGRFVVCDLGRGSGFFASQVVRGLEGKETLSFPYGYYLRPWDIEETTDRWSLERMFEAYRNAWSGSALVIVEAHLEEIRLASKRPARVFQITD